MLPLSSNERGADKMNNNFVKKGLVLGIIVLFGWRLVQIHLFSHQPVLG